MGKNFSSPCCDMGQNDTIGKIELIPFSVCLMSKESMEITINTYE